jgi:hypothetical protein
MAPAHGVPLQDLATDSVDKINIPVRGIQDHALIGNLRTAALVSIDGSIESMCIPYFDSPSVFARILDADKGGHFSITPTWNFKPKQAYAPNSNVLVTKFLSEDGVGVITDLLVPKGANTYRKGEKTHLPWLIRKVESIRGKVPFRMECAPAFNYCRDKHTTEVSPTSSEWSLLTIQLVKDDSAATGVDHENKALFTSPDLSLDLRYLSNSNDESVSKPTIKLKTECFAARGLLGDSVTSDFELEEGQSVTFVLREVGDWQYSNEEHQRVANPDPERAAALGIPLATLLEATSRLRPPQNPMMTQALLDDLMSTTGMYWRKWIAKSCYKGRWRENVNRSALTL